MSTPASEADDITQLSFELEGLRISITRTRTAGPSGPTALAGPARAPVAAFEAAPSTPVASSGHRGSSAGSLGRSPNPHTRSPWAPPSRALQLRPLSLRPQVLLDSARLLRSSASAPLLRAQRAWTAGCWAAAVIEGRVNTPNCTPPLSIPSRYYIVLRSLECSHVQVTQSRDTYLRLVDHHRSSYTLSHGFPTETKARIYVAGAGLLYPSSTSR